MRGPERALGEQYCGGAAPAARREPVSETSRSRRPNKTAEQDRRDNGSGAAGEGVDKLDFKQLVLAGPLFAGLFLRSLVTGLCPEREEAGRGPSPGPGKGLALLWQLLGHRWGRRPPQVLPLPH